VLGYLVGSGVGVVLLVKLYFKMMAGVCKSQRRLDGKVAIVTGSNSGIGYETAKELARRGAKVILACRTVESAERCAARIRSTTGNKQIVVKKLDLSSLKSVREFCKDVLKEETRLDIIVNNAGVAGLRKSVDEDGMELHFTTNHFGPFLMTNILLGLMKKGKEGRIVSVSSLAHKWTKDLPLDNLNSEKKWEPKVLYARTKLANVLFTKELSRRLKEAGLDGIVANAVNPGGVQTSIFRHARKAFKYMIMVSQFFFKTPYEGAQTVVHACVSEDVDGKGGLYWTDCKVDKPSKLGQDADLAKRLWDRSAELVKLSREENHLV